MNKRFKGFIGTNIGKMSDHLGLLDFYVNVRERIFGNSAVILIYHRVDEPNRFPWAMTPTRIKNFEKEMEYLTNKYNVISLDFLEQIIREGRSIPRKAVVITFDDGFKDNYLNAYPILKKYNVPATIFITTGYIGSDELNWRDKVNYGIWNTSKEMFQAEHIGNIPLHTGLQRRIAASKIKTILEEMPKDNRCLYIEGLLRKLKVRISPELNKEFMLSWEEIREMNKNGIGIGSHSISHPVLTEISLEDAKKEIIESKRHIEEKLDKHVIAFAYPYGKSDSYNESIKEIVKTTGYTCAAICANFSPVKSDTDIYELERISSGRNAEIFKLYVSRFSFDLGLFNRK